MKKPQCLLELKNKIEQPKTQENVTVCMLVAGIVAPFALGLSLMIVPTFPQRDDLISAGILGYAIAFFGALAVAFIAALTIRQTNKRIQTYSWRRDQALRDVERIYEPLYKDVSEIHRTTETLEYDCWPQDNWNSVYDSFLGSKLRIIDINLCERLEGLFYNANRYETTRRIAIERVRKIASETIERYIDPTLEEDVKRMILTTLPDSLNCDQYVYRGFVMGNTVRIWSFLHFQDEDRLLEEALLEIKKQPYCPHQSFTFKQIEDMLNEIYEVVQQDSTIQECAKEFKFMFDRAGRVKKDLEQHILGPQLL